MASPEYPKTSVNAVKRYAGRGTYDYATIHDLINQTPVLHVAFNDSSSHFPSPVCLPMLGVTGNFADQSADPSTSPQDLYIHGYVSARLLKAPSNSTEEEGLPITITATFMDGLVLALTPNHHSCNYRSAVVYGYATLVTDDSEKLWAMEHITNNMLPDRWSNSRIPPTKAEYTSTSILRVKIAHASAKVRTGGPGDDRADLKNEEVTRKVWAGTVPCWLQWGEPIPGSNNSVDEVPNYIEAWRVKTNTANRLDAFKATEE